MWMWALCFQEGVCGVCFGMCRKLVGILTFDPFLRLQKTAMKEGPNHGRDFYTCAKAGVSCGFFEWADGMPSCDGTTASGSRTRGRGRGRGRGGRGRRGRSRETDNGE